MKKNRIFVLGILGVSLLGSACGTNYTGNYSGSMTLTMPNMPSTPVPITLALSDISNTVSGTLTSSQFTGTLHGTESGPQLNTTITLNSIGNSYSYGGGYPSSGFGGISAYNSISFSGTGTLSLLNSKMLSGTLTGPVTYGGVSSGITGTLTINAQAP